MPKYIELGCAGESIASELMREGSPTIESGLTVLREFEANSDIEALIIYHIHNGWEPWIPMDEDRAEYLNALRVLGYTPGSVNDQRESHGLPRLAWLDAAHRISNNVRDSSGSS